MEKEILIKAEDICKEFGSKHDKVKILKNIDLEIYKNDFTIIMGSSGSGKSTLLYALSGMDNVTSGHVLFDQVHINKMSKDKVAKFRRKKCGFVFQQNYLLNNMGVMDNIFTSGLLCTKNRKEIRTYAEQLLEQVGICKERWNNRPNKLSGGEAQRVSIVRALINKPLVLFADEPTGALNKESTKNVLDVFTMLNENGQTMVVVTHDILTALRGDRIIYIVDGCVQDILNLKKYCEDDLDERHKRVDQFLKKQGW
jgi:putative ABC transport system ATP-binding protein